MDSTIYTLVYIQFNLVPRTKFGILVLNLFSFQSWLFFGQNFRPTLSFIFTCFFNFSCFRWTYEGPEKEWSAAY